jgi:hypothetical protein
MPACSAEGVRSLHHVLGLDFVSPRWMVVIKRGSAAQVRIGESCSDSAAQRRRRTRANTHRERATPSSTTSTQLALRWSHRPAPSDPSPPGLHHAIGTCPTYLAQRGGQGHDSQRQMRDTRSGVVVGLASVVVSDNRWLGGRRALPGPAVVSDHTCPASSPIAITFAAECRARLRG